MKTFLACACIAVFGISSAVAQPMPNADGRFAAPGALQSTMPVFALPSQMAEAQLAYIRVALKPTDEQKPLWEAYASLIMKNALEMDRTFTQGARTPEAGEATRQWPNAIESLEQEQSFHAEMVRRIGELLEVERPLYEALSPAQRKAADVLLIPDLIEY